MPPKDRLFQTKGGQVGSGALPVPRLKRSDLRTRRKIGIPVLGCAPDVTRDCEEFLTSELESGARETHKVTVILNRVR